MVFDNFLGKLDPIPERMPVHFNHRMFCIRLKIEGCAWDEKPISQSNCKKHKQTSFDG